MKFYFLPIILIVISLPDLRGEITFSHKLVNQAGHDYTSDTSTEGYLFPIFAQPKERPISGVAWNHNIVMKLPGYVKECVPSIHLRSAGGYQYNQVTTPKGRGLLGAFEIKNIPNSEAIEFLRFTLNGKPTHDKFTIGITVDGMDQKGHFTPSELIIIHHHGTETFQVKIPTNSEGSPDSADIYFATVANIKAGDQVSIQANPKQGHTGIQAITFTLPHRELGGFAVSKSPVVTGPQREDGRFATPESPNVDPIHGNLFEMVPWADQKGATIVGAIFGSHGNQVQFLQKNGSIKAIDRSQLTKQE